MKAPQKQSVTIDEGWVARANSGIIHYYENKPVRDAVYGKNWFNGGRFLKLPYDSFPDLKWEDEPKEVKITIEEV